MVWWIVIRVFVVCLIVGFLLFFFFGVEYLGFFGAIACLTDEENHKCHTNGYRHLFVVFLRNGSVHTAICLMQHYVFVRKTLVLTLTPSSNVIIERR